MLQAPQYTRRLAIRARDPGRSRFALRLQPELLVSSRDSEEVTWYTVNNGQTNTAVKLYHGMQQEDSTNKNKNKLLLYNLLFDEQVVRLLSANFEVT